MKDAIQEAMRQGIAFLVTAQHRHGGFLSWSWPAGMPKEAWSYRSVFSTALILDALTTVSPSPKLQSLRSRAAAFLLEQKSQQWSFNYWERGSKEASTMPYPDDLDDTFAALAALKNHNPELIGGEVMAHVVMMLAALEAKPGGPYRTWLVAPDAPAIWRDVDFAVNANVAYFLRLNGIDLPGLEDFLERRIGAKTYASPYYPSPYPIFYYLARVYEGRDSGPLLKHISAYRRRNLTETLLERSLAASALLRLGQPPETVEEDIGAILRAAHLGDWKALPFCIDPARAGTAHHSGSPALTAAFALEALALANVKRAAPLVNTSIMDAKSAAVRDSIERSAKTTLRELPRELGAAAQNLFVHIAGKERGNQIFLLPYWWGRELTTRSQVRIPASLSTVLGLANLWGWMAYTAYDDILDENSARAKLSPANFALRELTLIYADIFPAESHGRRLFVEILGRVDAANAWELEYCAVTIENGVLTPPSRLPDFGNYESLAERSLGHALGPLSLMLIAGYKRRSQLFQAALGFFSCYLAARQLNDDAHDWWEDLELGRINAVGARVLGRWKKTHGAASIDLAAVKGQMQRLFWEYELKPVGQNIDRLLRRARQTLSRLPIKDKAVFEGMLSPLEGAAKIARQESAQALDFLKAYKSSPD